ncbi:MAG: glycosyltransferase family 9 protein [Nitrospira sp.]|nr:glycosyltransferase family 9 protein [Nitrospira sp.]
MAISQEAESSSIPCNLCGGTEVSTLSNRSRSGKPLRTVICKSCGLVWSDPRPHRKGVSLDQPWIAMNVSARWPTKRWFPGSFAAVLDRLHQEGLGPVVVIGSAGDQHDVEQLRTLTNSPFVDLTGAVPLGSLPALLSKASAMITNDSGPMHIAAALGVPVAAIFGPTSAIRTGPYGAGHRVLTASVPCRPCFSRVCRHTPEMECLHLVTPDNVVEAAQRLVAASVRPS